MKTLHISLLLTLLLAGCSPLKSTTSQPESLPVEKNPSYCLPSSQPLAQTLAGAL